MIAIGNGESCPFCKGDDKFISNKDNNFLKHLIETHPKEMEESLFGGKDIGI